MSDRQLRNSISNGVSKRAPRKASTSKDSDAQQRERKRALDRKAQRASREKTRAHIANLERMVQILSEKNGDAATSELLEEMGRMKAEIERLRKIIDSIKSLLGVHLVDVVGEPAARRVSHFPKSPQQDAPTPRDPHPNQSPAREVQPPDAEADADSEEPAVEVDQGNNWSILNREEQETNQDAYMEEEDEVDDSPEEMEETIQPESARTPINVDWMDSIDVGSVALMGHSNHPRPQLQHTPFWDLPSPVKTRIADLPTPGYAPCKIWQKANAIYAKIFQFEKEQLREADKAESGSLIKVVKEGWDVLSLEERNNPILQILKDVDQQLFWDLDPVTKIANLYKSLLLLKYYFNAEPHNLERMPLWQRPVHSQKVRRHPIPIDFFPWPALRDRLVRHHNFYFSTSDFSVQYREHFKFSWPFGFEETYRYDPHTQTYSISPLFDQYHRDMKCWGMEEVFFEKYPELTGEMSVHVAEPMDDVGLPDDIAAELDMDADFGMGIGVDNNGLGMQHSNGFVPDVEGYAEQVMMDLFDEYPPT